MRIGFDAKRAFNNFSGLGNYSRTLIGDVSSDYPNNSYTLFTPKINRCSVTEPFINNKHLSVVTPKCKRLKNLWRQWGIIKDIAAQKIDIYHGLSHDLPMPIKGKKRGQTKYVVTIHDVCYRTYPDMYSFVERAIYRKKYSHSLRYADAIIAISESTKRDILRFFPFVDSSKIHTIYQALNPVYYTPMECGEAKSIVQKRGVEGSYFLYVGSINSRKNLLGVVKAYSEIKSDNRPKLVVVGGGNGSYKSEIDNFIKRASLTDSVLFFNDIRESRELQAFYTQALVLVYPSFYEGFGLPVAESLLCGTAVITSNISSLPEAAGDGAIYVEPNDIGSIRQAMERSMEDSQLLKELAREGRKYIEENFNPKKLTAQLESLYQQILM